MIKAARLFWGFGVAIIALSCWTQRNTNTVLPATEVALGKLLFFDPILSEDKSVSCASCHLPQFAFADTLPFSKGVRDQFTSRNAPSAMNVAGRPYLFWDGRSPTLEDQVLHPIANPVEMGFNLHKLVGRLISNKFYASAFNQIYNAEPNATLLGKAIAAYERTLETGDSPFDAFMQGDSTAISTSAMRGRELFVSKAHCFDCHFSPDFTGDEFRNIGLFNGHNLNDSGRFNVTKDPVDIGKFKVPGLRNVALTAPYMHNGMFGTLESVIEYYNNPEMFVINMQGKDALVKPLHLSATEKNDLLNFLKSLTAISLLKSK